MTLVSSIAEKSIFVILTLAVCLGLLYLCDYREVSIVCDGETIETHAFTDDGESILAANGFATSEDDVIYSHELQGKTEVVLYKAHTVTVIDGDGEATECVSAGTVADVFEKLGIELGKKDSSDVAPETIITSDLTVNITRDGKIALKCDGKTIYCDKSAGTVKNLLKENGITLGKNDRVNYKLSKKLKDGMKVVVQRVTYEYSTVEETIKYKTKKRKDSTLNEGTKKVIQKGKNGKQTLTYLNTMVDGKISESILVSVEVTKKATKKIVLVGTKKVIGNVVTTEKVTDQLTQAATTVTAAASGNSVSGGVISELTPDTTIALDSNGKPIHYKKMMVGEATAYSSGTTCSTGVAAMPGRVAVDPREIPYGTKMYVVSVDGKYNYGYCVAADTGGFIYTSDTVLDLRFNTETECVNFGRRDVEIYFLED